MRLLTILAAGAATVLLAGTASAGTYDFSLEGGPYSGSGHFITTTQLDDSELITGIDGKLVYTKGAVVTSDFEAILAPGTLGTNDNLLFKSKPYLDAPGVSFRTGYDSYNLFGYLDGGSVHYQIFGVHIPTAFEVSLTIGSGPSDAPEPASWALMLIGFGASGTALRRTRKRAVRFG